MAVTLNKNSFCRIRRLPLFASKQTFARIDYLRQGERLVGKKALRMLNFRLKTRQNQVFHIHTHRQRHRKHVHLRSPGRAVTGHALKVKTTLTYKLNNSPTYKLKLIN